MSQTDHPNAGDREFFWTCSDCGYVNTLDESHCQRTGCKMERNK